MFDLTILDYVYIGIILGSTIWATLRGGFMKPLQHCRGSWPPYLRDLRPRGWIKCCNLGLICRGQPLAHWLRLTLLYFLQF